jgi:hypothetical protein
VRVWVSSGREGQSLDAGELVRLLLISIRSAGTASHRCSSSKMHTRTTMELMHA